MTSSSSAIDVHQPLRAVSIRSERVSSLFWHSVIRPHRHADELRPIPCIRVLPVDCLIVHLRTVLHSLRFGRSSAWSHVGSDFHRISSSTRTRPNVTQIDQSSLVSHFEVLQILGH